MHASLFGVAVLGDAVRPPVAPGVYIVPHPGVLHVAPLLTRQARVCAKGADKDGPGQQRRRGQIMVVMIIMAIMAIVAIIWQ